jgi:regulator of protease activity HflC (stomatin/prohibitin superfamily)
MVVNPTRGTIDLGGSMPSMPNLRLARSTLLGIVVAFVVLLLLWWSTTSIPTGIVGVLTQFGKVTNETLSEGIHLINPFKSSTEMSIRTQEIKESASVPSAEGLVMNLDTSLIYHLDPAKAAEVYQKIGPNYLVVFIEPNLRAAIRETIRVDKRSTLRFRNQRNRDGGAHT